MKKPFDMDKSVAGAIKRFPLTLARLKEAERRADRVARLAREISDRHHEALKLLKG